MHLHQSALPGATGSVRIASRLAGHDAQDGLDRPGWEDAGDQGTPAFYARTGARCLRSVRGRWRRCRYRGRCQRRGGRSGGRVRQLYRRSRQALPTAQSIPRSQLGARQALHGYGVGSWCPVVVRSPAGCQDQERPQSEEGRSPHALDLTAGVICGTSNKRGRVAARRGSQRLGRYAWGRSVLATMIENACFVISSATGEGMSRSTRRR